MEGTRHRWNLIGADRQAAMVFDHLARRDCGGVVLVGAAGVGKTTVARAVVAHAQERGRATVRVVATASTSHVRFGSLGHLLTDLEDTTAGGDGIAQRITRTFETERAGSPDALVVLLDDAPLLDPASATLIATLVRRDLVQVIATARTHMALPADLDGMIVEHVLLRHEVRPMERPVLEQVVTDALGGPVHPTATRIVWESSRGIPLYARELVSANLAAGVLRAGPDGWTFNDAPEVPPSLIQLVSSRFARLGDAERQTFEVLAFAQPLPLAAAIDVAGVDLLADLERAELVTVTQESERTTVRLAHPLFEEALRACSGPLQRKQALERALAAIDSITDPDPDLALRAACLCLDHDLPLPPERALAAGRRALALVDPGLAESLCRRAGHGFEATFTLGAALTAQGRVDEAELAFGDAMTAAESDADRARVISRRGNNLGAGAGRFDEAVAVLASGAEEIDDPLWRSFIQADLNYALLWAGEVHNGRDEPTPQDKPEAVRANECLVGAVVAVMSGELSLADAYVSEGLPLASALRHDVPMARELLMLSRFLSLAFAGSSRRASEVLAVELDRSASRSEAAPGTWFAVRAMQRLFNGNVSAALLDAAEAEHRLAIADISGLRPLAQAVRATAHAALGDIEASLAASASVDETWRDETKVRVQLATAAAWRDVSAGETRGAAAALAAAGMIALEANHVPFAALAAYDAVRLGHPRPALPVLRLAAARMEGDLGSTFLAHATALDQERPDDLLKIAHVLPSLGFTLPGAEAATQAAILFGRGGDVSTERRANYHAATIAQPLGDVRSPTLGTPRGLTPREEQIARLAVDGRTSRAIADELDISARTVDNHLAVAYQKLGVRTRSELAGLVDLR